MEKHIGKKTKKEKEKKDKDEGEEEEMKNILIDMIRNVENPNEKINGIGYLIKYLIKHDYTDLLQELLKRKDVDVNMSLDKYGNTPLMRACYYESKECVKLLLDRKDINVNKRDTGSMSALYNTIDSGYDNDIAKILLDRDDIDVDSPIDSYGYYTHWRIIHIIAHKNNVELLEYMLKKKKTFDINAKNDEGENALYIACVGNKKTIVKLLLQHKDIDVNITRFHRPCFHESKSTIAALLLKRNDLDITNKDFYGNDAFHNVCTKDVDIVKIFVDKYKQELDINKKNYEKQSPLMIACLENNLPIMKYLVENFKDIDVNTITKKKRTILHVAMKRSQIDIVRYIVTLKEFNFCAVDKYGNNAFHECNNNKDILDVLLNIKSSLNVNQKNNDGMTPLQYLLESKIHDYKYYIPEKFIIAYLENDRIKDNINNPRKSDGFTALNIAYYGKSRADNENCQYIINHLINAGAYAMERIDWSKKRLIFIPDHNSSFAYFPIELKRYLCSFLDIHYTTQEDLEKQLDHVRQLKTPKDKKSISWETAFEKYEAAKKRKKNN